MEALQPVCRGTRAYEHEFSRILIAIIIIVSETLSRLRKSVNNELHAKMYTYEPKCEPTYIRIRNEINRSLPIVRNVKYLKRQIVRADNQLISMMLL